MSEIWMPAVLAALVVLSGCWIPMEAVIAFRVGAMLIEEHEAEDRHQALVKAQTVMSVERLIRMDCGVAGPSQFDGPKETECLESWERSLCHPEPLKYIPAWVRCKPLPNTPCLLYTSPSPRDS